MNEEKLSLTEGVVWKKLIRFAIPIFLGNLLPQKCIDLFLFELTVECFIQRKR